MKPSVSKENLRKALKVIADTMADIDVPYFICYGTLLGFVRNNDVIDNDDDVDILISIDDYKAFWEKIRTVPNITHFYHDNDSMFDAFYISIDDITVQWDVYVYKFEPTNKYLIETQNFVGNNTYMELPIEYCLPIRKEGMADIEVYVPANPTALVKYLYGERYTERLLKNIEYTHCIIDGKPVLTYNK